MSDLPHLRLEGEPTPSPYTYAGAAPQGAKFDLPPRNQPAHAGGIRQSLVAAGDEAKRLYREEESAHPELVEWKPEGLVLTFESDAGHPLTLKGLEHSGGIHLLGLTEHDGVQTARVFVPGKKLDNFLRLVDTYASSIVLTYLAQPENENDLRGAAR